MLRWAVIFLVIALVAGVLGFAGIAGAASNIACLPDPLCCFSCDGTSNRSVTKLLSILAKPKQVQQRSALLNLFFGLASAWVCL
jgi:hypothetical protein